MAITGQWTIACIVVDGAGQLFGIRDKSHDPKLQEIHESGSGDPFPTFAAVQEGTPTVSFSTQAISSAIGVLGLTPFSVVSGGVSIYYQKYLRGGLRDATGAVKFHYTDGMFVPKTISASQKGGSATIGYDFHGISPDGETQPYTFTINESLPAITPVTEAFKVGPVRINGTSLQGVQKTDIDFAYKVITNHSDGQPWPTFCGVENLMPKVKFTGLDLAGIDSFTNTSIALTSWTAYLRAMKHGSISAGVGEAMHIELSGTAGMLCSEKAGGSHGRESDVGWCIYPTRDASNPAFLINPASTIG